MNEMPKMVTNPRPLPLRKPVKWGGKLKWKITSFRFPPDLHAFLKKDAEEEQVDMAYIVTEVLLQYMAFKQVKKKSARR